MGFMRMAALGGAVLLIAGGIVLARIELQAPEPGLGSLPSPPSPSAVDPAETASPIEAPTTPAPASRVARSPEASRAATPSAEAAPPVPLERLLAIPETPRQREIELGSSSEPAPSVAKPSSARLRPEIDRAREHSAARPGSSVSRTDLGVSVGSDSTRVRGGVRVESTEETKRDPARTPMVGIEKRF